MTFSLVASLGRVSSKVNKFASCTVVKNLLQRYANLKHLLRSQTWSKLLRSMKVNYWVSEQQSLTSTVEDSDDS